MSLVEYKDLSGFKRYQDCRYDGYVGAHINNHYIAKWKLK